MLKSNDYNIVFSNTSILKRRCETVKDRERVRVALQLVKIGRLVFFSVFLNFRVINSAESVGNNIMVTKFE